ncbi:MAG: ATP synthase F1 subunit delta [Pirellulales bacterium]
MSASATSESAINVGQEQVALVYAKAFLASTEKAGETAARVEELTSLVDDVLVPQPQFAAVLGSRRLAHEEKTALIDRVFGGKASPLLLSFLKVLSSHGRLDALQAIGREVRARYDEQRGRKRVRITAATALDKPMLGELTEKLRAMLGGEPVLEVAVRPELIGGILIRVGDTVYDGSVASRLARLRTQMIDRSIHEIQSRRDRFCNPTGD